MAENSDSRDSDNSWVIAGSEGLPVETVGPELGTVTQTPVDEEPAGHALPKGHSTEDVHTAGASPGRKSEGSQLDTSPSPEETEFKIDPQTGIKSPLNRLSVQLDRLRAQSVQLTNQPNCIRLRCCLGL